MADAVLGTTDELLKTREALATLGVLWRERRKFRQGSASLRALDVLPHYPVLTVKCLAKFLEITVQAVSQAVDQLVERKILLERTGYARNRVFIAPDARSIINRPFGEDPIHPGPPL
jgi:DNA-binding MarR family transcriptional regulator